MPHIREHYYVVHQNINPHRIVPIAPDRWWFEEGDFFPREYTMNNGLKIPAIGLGTASYKNTESMVNAIMNAGYTHIDTAFIYNNEEIVGQAL